MGVVYVISAEREVGKSFRRTRVRERWSGAVSFLVVLFWGERVMFHASPFRNRVFELEGRVVDDVVFVFLGMGLFVEEDNARPDCKSSSWCVSSHCVSQFPARKSGCDTMPRRTSRFVFTPVIWVSDSARLAFRTQSFHDAAVMMSLARRLSKSADTTVAWLAIRWVSTRMPLPVGNWKDVILPMERDQLLCTFSAVMRS